MLDKVHEVTDKLSGKHGEIASLNCVQNVSDGKRSQCDAVILGSITAKIRTTFGSTLLQKRASRVATSVNALWQSVTAVECSTLGPSSTFAVQELVQQAEMLSAEISNLRIKPGCSRTRAEELAAAIMAKTQQLSVEDNISHAACSPVSTLRLFVHELVTNRPRIATPDHTLYMSKQRAKTGISSSNPAPPPAPQPTPQPTSRPTPRPATGNLFGTGLFSAPTVEFAF